MYKLILVVLAVMAAVASAQVLYSPYAYSAGYPLVRSFGAYPYANTLTTYGSYGAYASPYVNTYLYK